eukprot:scaffold168137_cov63-Cyclotella_meneghiniana.AAC.3
MPESDVLGDFCEQDLGVIEHVTAGDRDRFQRRGNLPGPGALVAGPCLDLDSIFDVKAGPCSDCV